MVRPHYATMTTPEFYEPWNKVMPRLQEYEEALDKAIQSQQRELDPKLKKVLEEAFKCPASGRASGSAASVPRASHQLEHFTASDESPRSIPARRRSGPTP